MIASEGHVCLQATLCWHYVFASGLWWLLSLSFGNLFAGGRLTMILQPGIMLVEELLRNLCDDLESCNTIYGVPRSTI